MRPFPVRAVEPPRPIPDASCRLRYLEFPEFLTQHRQGGGVSCSELCGSLSEPGLRREERCAQAHKFGCVSKTGDSILYELAASSEFERGERLARVRGGRSKRATEALESCRVKNSGNSPLRYPLLSPRESSTMMVKHGRADRRRVASHKAT
jgi:hypothetical protein